MVCLQFLHVIVLEALMFRELPSSELFNADLALDHDLWAESFDVVSQLGSCHVLEFLEVADIAAILGALVVLSVLLELSYRFPVNFAIDGFVALVGELAEVNAVSNDWIDLNQEIAFALAVGAHHCFVLVLLLVILITISVESAGFIILLSEPLHSLSFSSCWGSVENFSIFLHELLDQVLVLNNLWIFLEK
jgi:hypothetical protein